jgi:ATP-dependent RNA helicase DHX8/PRP22
MTNRNYDQKAVDVPEWMNGASYIALCLFRFYFTRRGDTCCRVVHIHLDLVLCTDRRTHILGRMMASLPVDPMCAVMLLQSLALGCAEDALSIVAMLSVESIFYSPRNLKEKAAASRAPFVSLDGDQLMLLSVYTAYMSCPPKARFKWCRDHFINSRAMHRVENVRAQLREYLQRHVRNSDSPHLELTSALPDTVPVRKAILAGFFLHSAVRAKSVLDSTKSVYQTMCLTTKEEVKVHPSSVMFMRNPTPTYVVFHELVYTSKHYIRNIIAIEKEWLIEAAPAFFKRRDRFFPP